MLIYVDELVREVESIREYAEIIKEKFAQGRSADELLLDAKALDARIVNLQEMMPEETSIGSLRRHSHFMRYWLDRGDINSCKQDIVDIVDHDLPFVLDQIKDWSRSLIYVDAELRDDVLPLLRTKQFDSAIRKAFVILKARLCEKFSLGEENDGTKLINQVFGSKSEFLTDLDDGEKQAYRDLFAGLFGLLRNIFAHNNVQPTLSELDTVLSTINLCLRVIGDFREHSDE